MPWPAPPEPSPCWSQMPRRRRPAPPPRHSGEIPPPATTGSSPPPSSFPSRPPSNSSSLCVPCRKPPWKPTPISSTGPRFVPPPAGMGPEDPDPPESAPTRPPPRHGRLPSPPAAASMAGSSCAHARRGAARAAWHPGLARPPTPGPRSASRSGQKQRRPGPVRLPTAQLAASPSPLDRKSVV